MEIGKIIKIQPHHWACIEGFKGISYNAEHAKHFAEKANFLKDNPVANVLVTLGEDDLCLTCPHSLKEHKTCDKHFIREINNVWLAFLSLNENMVYKFSEVRERLIYTMNPKIHESICGRCGNWNLCKDTFMRSEIASSIPRGIQTEELLIAPV